LTKIKQLQETCDLPSNGKLYQPNSAADYARELFKPSKDS